MVNLVGFWLGDFGRHGFEVLSLEQTENHLRITKITGDENVPGGEVSFEGDIEKDEATGLLRVARKNFKNPSWVPATIQIHSNSSLTLHWNGDSRGRPFTRLNISGDGSTDDSSSSSRYLLDFDSV
mmetsp:Transcript_44874/g.62869  ORF Transcript_44874/g.62869 Transcript_44874/m.62869 type:complete len:126 (-) Transcript_44874:236-613(-)